MAKESMGNKTIFTIFECPFFDECWGPKARHFIDVEVTETVKSPECKVPYIQHNGKITCKLIIEEEYLDKYPANIKGVRFYNSISGRLERLVKR